MSNYLIVIVGPTAIGKTQLAIALAKYFNTEIISSDSRQFYKEMSIGTAVPNQEELQAVKHHCIQHLSIFDPYSVAQFEKECLELLAQLFVEKDIAVLVGGSGLYTDAVLYGLDHFPEVPNEIRRELNSIFTTQGITALQQKLEQIDPAYYQRVDIQNPHRLIRALEVSIASGKPYSSFLGKKPAQRRFVPLLIGLHGEREKIYERINHRVEVMVQRGLLEEAKRLYPHSHLNALQTVGYRELFAYFEGKVTLEEAISEIKKNTRRFAKRQLTWYRKNKSVIWLDYDLPLQQSIEYVHKELKAAVNAKK
ncbi:MAG: tRNA (adenosine(37)-N6)-dimethylallyltransferase MiaA [Bacteroidota bacterium]